MDQGVHRPAAPARRQRRRHQRPDRAARVDPGPRLRHGRARGRPARRHRRPRQGRHDLGQGGPQRGDRRGRRPRRRRARRHRRRAGAARRSREGDPRRHPLGEQAARPQPDRQRGRPHRRPRHHRAAPGVGRGRRAADRPRLGPVPAWRDAGAQRVHAGHAAHEPAARHADAGDAEALPPPLQHAAVGQRRDRPRRLAEAPRDRPRRPRRPVRAARGPQPGGLRLHAAPRQRGAQLERLDLDGRGRARRACR